MSMLALSHTPRSYSYSGRNRVNTTLEKSTRIAQASCSSFLFSVLSLDTRPSRDWPVVSCLRVSLFDHTSYPSADKLSCSLILLHPLGQYRGAPCSQRLGKDS